jgi:2,4-dienoyl-CoA reductase-like NADH-dependent reductase (Old Yellow Enzyme family)
MSQYAAKEGLATGWHFDHYAHMALSGIGGAVVECTAISPKGRITPDCLGLWDDDQIAGMSRIVDTFHRHAVPVGVQISHAGRKASTDTPWNNGAPLPATDPRHWETEAPSALKYDDDWPTPRALTLADIAQVRADFVSAAKRAIAAGFDFIEIHGAHGYLLHGFVSPLCNTRDDMYGGSAQNRMRLPLEVAADLRATVPDDMPLFYRASCIDRVDGGLTIDDSVALVHGLKTAGVDLIDCSAGGAAKNTNGAFITGDITEQHDMAARIKADTGIATLAVGGIHSPEMALSIVKDGKADLVAFASEMLNNFDFPRQCAEAFGLENPDFVQPKRYAFYNQFTRGAS